VATKKNSKAKPTGVKKRAVAKVTKRKAKGPAKPKRHTPVAKSPEPRKALETSTELHDESAKAPTKNYAPEPTLASDEDLDEEIDAIADGTEDGDAEPSEVDDEDDEGYF
jgi:hypothetical protein